jgi:hypothetical protein
MNTPITDAASETDAFDSPMNARAFARRLELDRAALMEALIDLQRKHERLTALIDWPSQNALAAARANFPTT